MKIKWFDRKDPHQLDIRFVWNGSPISVQAYCSCGVILLTGTTIYAESAISCHKMHLRNVEG